MAQLTAFSHCPADSGRRARTYRMTELFVVLFLWKTRSMGLRSPCVSWWKCMPSSNNPARSQGAPSTRNSASSMACLSCSSCKNIFVAAVFLDEVRPTCRIRLVSGLTAATNKNRSPLTLTTVSSSTIWAESRPPRGSRFAFCTQLWTVDRARPAPKISRI